MTMTVGIPEETKLFCVVARKEVSLRDDGDLDQLQIAS